MPASFLGQITVGGEIPGVTVLFQEIEVVMGAIRDTISDALTGIATVEDALRAMVGTLEAFFRAIRALAVGDLEAALSSARDALLGLLTSLTDPQQYVDRLLAGIAQVQADVVALVPVVDLTAAISALQQIIADLLARIGLFDTQLAVVEEVIAQIRELAASLLALSSRLNALVAVILQSLAEISALLALLATSGAYALAYEGPINLYGTDLATALATTGIPGGAIVRSAVILTQTADAPATAALSAVFRTS